VVVRMVFRWYTEDNGDGEPMSIHSIANHYWFIAQMGPSAQGEKDATKMVAVREGGTMKQARWRQSILGSLVLLALAACVPPEVAPAPTSIPTPVPTVAPTSVPTPTPDPCTGWWCTVTGVVYAGTAQPGDELEGATVTLQHSSYCSPTRGERQIKTGPDGGFAFEEVFLHDTDRIRIEVTFEGYESAQWDSVDRYCFYCSCFGEPLEIVLGAAPGP